MVRLVTTGRTIASTEEAAEGSGYTVSEEADAIVDAVPILDYFSDIEVDRTPKWEVRIYSWRITSASARKATAERR